MEEQNHQPPGIVTLLVRLARTALGAIQNRVELIAVEWQEERIRLTELLIRVVCLVFLGVMGVTLATATIILAVPAEHRLWVMAGFAVLYLAGAVFAFLGVRSALSREPFTESIQQARKDKGWLKSLE